MRKSELMVFGIPELVSVNAIPPPLPNTPVGTDRDTHQLKAWRGRLSSEV